MANTFLNTGRTAGMATNNVQANVDQVNQGQAVQNNVNGTSGVQANVQANGQVSGQQSNQVNPITIPIQIQPQMATTGQPQVTAPQQDQNLQVGTQQNYNNAPTPQQYQNNNANNNIVDFNQIYKNYNEAMGNNNATQGNSGIKKTSYNTTIVTPTIANLNSVEGQYQSAYSNTINSLISEMLNNVKKGFQYDPTQDAALKMATEYAANSTLQSLAGSGVLNSSATAERVARIVSELIPQYEEKAHNRWIEYLGQLADTAQTVMSYDSQQFEYWKDAKDREFKNKEFEFNKQQKALENAWKRVDELGYVDNNASSILGVPVGTLSGEARLAKEQREFELQKMREQAEIEHANNVALYKLKSELDTQQSKNLTEYEYQMAQKYGKTSSSSSSNSSNTTSMNTYREIINNRYADYDENTRKYIVNDNTGLYNYLVTEYTNGRLSATDLANLTAMYGVTQPTTADAAKQERINYLNSLN